MMPVLGDHVLIALIAVVYPFYFALGWSRRIRPQLASGEADARPRTYRESMIELWLLTGLVLSWWSWSGRTWSAIGLGAPGGTAFWIGLAVVAVVAVALGGQVATVHRSAEAREQVRRQVQQQLGTGAALMIPRNIRERRMWVGLSLSAGFCEEVLYRGFLIGYLMTWLPAPAAVAVSAIVFGVPHFYLGWGGMLQATVSGGLFAVTYLLTGSLWVPIALHCAVDVASGWTGSAGFSDEAAVAKPDRG